MKQKLLFGKETLRLMVQRLRAPTTWVNPYSFGGGLPAGGLSKESFELILKCCSFDYMGRAEFEFGAIPKSFQAMVDRKQELRGVTHNINANVVYILAPESLLSDIQALLDKVLAEKLSRWTRSVEFKEPTYIRESFGLDASMCSHEDIIGWLACSPNNEDLHGWMYFKSQEMFLAFCQLFGVDSGLDHHTEKNRSKRKKERKNESHKNSGTPENA